MHVLLLVLIRVTNCYVISQSEVSKCIQRSNGKRDCAFRLLINSVVTTGVNGTEYIQVDSVTDASGSILRLENPINITISKAPVYVRYSTVYVGDVNSKPKESLGSTSMLTCAANPSAASSGGACSPLMYIGQQVQYSGGFCCPCSLDQMIGLGSRQRGDIQCNLFSGLFGTGASVHCLRWGDIWYSVFRLMTPTIESLVRVTIPNDASLDVTGQSPVASLSVNNSLNITARLVGSFNWVRAPTDWGLSSYVVAPNIPGSVSASDARFAGWTPSNPFKHGLLIPFSSFDLSGRTCNKIGVSHYAFVNDQGSRCSGNVGDCLGNQIEDIWLSSKASDLVPAKLCQSIGGVFVENDNYRLSCRLDNSSNDVPTQVLIEMNAAAVSIIVNEAYGDILNVSVTVNIQALTQTALVFVEVQNTGVLTSEFIVSVSECNPNTLTLPLAGTRFSLAKNQGTLVTVKIEDSQIEGIEYSCQAILADSDGRKLDAEWFNLTLSSVSIDKGAQSDNGQTNGDDISTGPGGLDPCSTVCDGFFSLLCFVSNSCWSKLGTLLGTIGGIGLGTFLFFKLGGVSLIGKVFRSICSCCCTRDSTASQKRRLSYPEIPPVRPFEYYPHPPYTSQAYLAQYYN